MFFFFYCGSRKQKVKKQKWLSALRLRKQNLKRLLGSDHLPDFYTFFMKERSSVKGFLLYVSLHHVSTSSALTVAKAA